MTSWTQWTTEVTGQTVTWKSGERTNSEGLPQDPLRGQFWRMLEAEYK